MISGDPAEAALMAAVCAAPADDEPRLAYAAWAEHAGSEGVQRADHIRRTIRLFRDRRELDNATTVRLLTPDRRAAWSNGVDGLGLLHYEFVRGFVASVLADATPLLATDIASRCPLQHVAVRQGGQVELAALLRATWMDQLVSLDLGRNGLTDADVHLIIGRGLPGLRWLNVDRNPISFAAVEALAAATVAGKFPELHTLLVPFNIYDEVEEAGSIQVTVFRPDRGTTLRATYGELPWLSPRPAGLGSSLYA